MKVLFIYPEYPATFWSFKYALPFIDKKAAFPPLGALTVASMLPEKWEKKLVDLNVRAVTDEEILWADMVMISAMIAQKKSAQEVILRVKELGRKVVAGGPVFTTGHDSFAGVDHFVLDEGEITVPMFLKDLEEGRLKPVYRSDEKPDLANTPVPDWSLINHNDYGSLAVQNSRGCPFNCEFCDIIVMNGRIPRLKKTEQIIAEFEAVYATGYRGSVFVVDDNFIGNKEKVKKTLVEIAKWMEAKNYPIKLYTEASINLADDGELMELMKNANFDSVFVGIETPDEEALKQCGKVQNTNKDMIESIRIIQRNGMQVQAGFILGFDTDNHRSFDNLVKFIQKSGIVTAMVGLLTALPETALYKKLNAAGRMIKGSSGINTDFSLNFVPKMDVKVLLDGYKRVLETIFSPRNYYERIITFMKQYKKSVILKAPSFKKNMSAFSKAIWNIGIQANSGKRHFWKMVLWTVFKKPNMLVEAITLAVYGYHFRTVMSKA